MTGPVERGRRTAVGPGSLLSPDQAKAETLRAIMLYAMLEVPAGLLLAGVFVYLFVVENGLTADEQVFWAMVGAGVFFVYGLALVLTIVLPAARRGKESRERAARAGLK